jgi:hypothetical protein
VTVDASAAAATPARLSALPVEHLRPIHDPAHGSGVGLPLYEVGHAWDCERHYAVLGREDQALRDEAGARGAKAVDAPSQPCGYITRGAACVSVGRHGT